MRVSLLISLSHQDSYSEAASKRTGHGRRFQGVFHLQSFQVRMTLFSHLEFLCGGMMAKNVREGPVRRIEFARHTNRIDDTGIQFNSLFGTSHSSWH